MACAITIDGVFGLGAGPPVVRVIGTVADCPADVEGNSVVIGISCVSVNGPFLERPAQIDASGRWQALIPIRPEDNCHCNQRVFVRARCATDPDCSTELIVTRLPCVECPAITLVDPDDDVTPPVRVECNPDGTASVTVNFFVFNTTTQLIHVQVQPGHPDGVIISGGIVGVTPGAGAPVSVILEYPTPSFPAPFIAILDISFQPTGCAPVPIPVGPIEPCAPAECPVITAIEVALGACERDPADGVSKRRVRFTPEVVGPTPVAHSWSFGDGTSQLILGPPAPIEHLYAATPVSAPELCMTGPEGCDTTCRAVPLAELDAFAPCECPALVTVAVRIGECERDPRDGRLKRRVTFIPTITGPAPSAHRWSFGDGSSELSAGPPVTTEHLYEETPTTEPELCISGPDPQCEDPCHQIPLTEFEPFEPCRDVPPPENGESLGCGALRLVMAVAGALAILAGLLAICVPPAATALFIIAGVFAAVALIAGIIYLIFCPDKPCRVSLLITGQATLGAGVAAIILSACCPWIIWAGLALAVAGLGTLLLWQRLCDRSACTLAREITRVIGGVVLPVIGIIVIIPVLTGCVSGLALAWVSAVFGPIAAYAASC